jgi:hypothetical protein
LSKTENDKAYQSNCEQDTDQSIKRHGSILAKVAPAPRKSNTVAFGTKPNLVAEVRDGEVAHSVRSLAIQESSFLPRPIVTADSFLDRIVHNAHRINLTGHSLRRSRANKPSKD